jgi:23S rRNA (guanosine2251-2'-O)-methyltransferase
MERVFGKHSARGVFLARPHSIRRVVFMRGADRYLDEFANLARAAGIQPEVLPREAFLRAGELTEDDKHQGIFVVTDARPVYGEHDLGLLAEASLVAVLDQVSDPQNFGSVLRSAAFFGADAVVWMKNRAVDLTPTVSRIAVGGAEFVKLFRITNMARTLEILKRHGYWVYGLDERGPSTLAETAFPAKTAVVIGAEGEGLRRRTKDFCDSLIRIPGGRPGMESLNAGVAAAVALSEVCRLRNHRERS